MVTDLRERSLTKGESMRTAMTGRLSKLEACGMQKTRNLNGNERRFVGSASALLLIRHTIPNARGNQQVMAT